jgi:hypothetical protein
MMIWWKLRCTSGYKQWALISSLWEANMWNTSGKCLKWSGNYV